MKTYPLVSIITINYKQAVITAQLLDSLRRITYPNIETIVVDNNSGSNDISKIMEYDKDTNLLCCLKNLGFSGGNNVGIAASHGDFILLLNNDTEVDPGFLEPMVDLMLQNQDIGAVSPKIKYFNHPGIIQYAGFSKMNPFTLRMHAIGAKKQDNAMYNQVNETPYAHGCAMLVKRKVIDEVGAMPEEYFLYYEEHDWSTQIKKAGFKIFYQPKSVVYHKESVSVVKNSPLKTYFISRNRILYMRRNFILINKLISIVYLILISFPKNILLYLVKRDYDHLQAYLDAIKWNLSHKTR